MVIMPKLRKNERCFFCNKMFPKELGRLLDILETGMDKKTKKETTECIGKSFVCFQCEDIYCEKV